MDDNYVVENETLRKVLDVVPYLYDLFEEDISFAVADEVNWIYNVGRGKLNIKSDIGVPVPEGGGAYIALHTGEFQVASVPAAVYGFPFKSYSVPIKEDGRVVGVLCMARSIERSAQLNKIASDLTASMRQIMTAMNEMADSVQNSVEVNNSVGVLIDKTVKTAENTDDILAFVQGIASKTKLLGLNASIEAARAGEVGRGFAVVAGEIEKMSAATSESVKKIADTLANLVNLNKEVKDQVDSTNMTFSEQASTIEEITASLTELENSFDTLNEMAKHI